MLLLVEIGSMVPVSGRHRSGMFGIFEHGGQFVDLPSGRKPPPNSFWAMA